MHTDCSPTKPILHLTIVELTLILRCLPTKHPQLITLFPYPGQDILVQDITSRNVKRPSYQFCNTLDVWSFRVTTNPFMKLFFENNDWKRRKD